MTLKDTECWLFLLYEIRGLILPVQLQGDIIEHQIIKIKTYSELRFLWIASEVFQRKLTPQGLSLQWGRMSSAAFCLS